MAKISDLLPTNILQQKQAFFDSPTLNPQFTYSRAFSTDELLKYGLPTTDLYDLAKEIIQRAYYKHTEADLYKLEGKILSQSEVTERVQKYLSEYSLSDRFSVTWSTDFMVRSSATTDEIKLRLPCSFREEGLVGMLYHEIGTHVLRRINDEIQPWHGKKKLHHMQPYLETEEGLASLHSQLAHSFPYNYIDALRYFAVYHAQNGSFLDVWHALTPYVDNLDRRWMICCRVKRGLEDAAQSGGYTKDMLYLSGSVKVWRWLTSNNCSLSILYQGKISLTDIDTMHGQVNHQQLLLPTFYTKNILGYVSDIHSIGITNSFDQITA